MTKWDGKDNEPGWAEVPGDEIAIPPGYRFLIAWQKGSELRMHVKPTIQLQYCTVCGAAVGPRGFDEPEFLDCRQRECTTRVIVHRQRYECKGERKHYPSDPMPGLIEDRHMSSRVRKGMQRSHDRSYRATAKSLGISDRTVCSCFRDDARTIAQQQRKSGIYLILIFDEKYKDGKAHFRVSCGVTHTMLEFLATDDPEQITKVLETYMHRDMVLYIVTDFAKKYDEMIAALYPKTIRLRDAWHLFGDLHEAREAVRLDAFQRATGDAKNALRGHKDFWREVSQRDWVGQQADLFAEGPLIAEANRAYLNFVDWWRYARTPIEAAEHFDFWAGNLPDSIGPFFQGFIDNIRKLSDEVFGYHATGITSGSGEAVNRNLQDLIDRGRHFSDEGLNAKMQVREDLKRRSAAALPGEPSELDPDRAAELSVENSLARSARMRRIWEKRGKMQVAAVSSVKGDAEPQPPERSSDPRNASPIPGREAEPATPAADAQDRIPPSSCDASANLGTAETATDSSPTGTD